MAEEDGASALLSHEVIRLTADGYNQFGEHLWINAALALGELGFDNPPKMIGISPSHQILEKAWEGLIRGRWDWAYGETDIPTWPEMVAAEGRAVLKLQKQDRVEHVTRLAQQRIDEVCKNEDGLILPGTHTPEQIAECERIRTAAKVIQTTVEAATTEAVLLAIDLTADDLWSADDTEGETVGLPPTPQS